LTRNRILIGAALAALAITGAALAQGAPAPTPASAFAQDPDMVGLVQRDCVGCHAIETVIGRGRTPDEWQEVIDRMVDHGMSASEVELAQIKTYLAKTLPAPKSAG
jgi:cytochrome c551/c552